MDNQLYYGDNLEVMRRHIKDESVDLVYLDPPLTVADLLGGKTLDMPPLKQVSVTFKKATRSGKAHGKQLELGM